MEVCSAGDGGGEHWRAAQEHAEQLRAAEQPTADSIRGHFSSGSADDDAEGAAAAADGAAAPADAAAAAGRGPGFVPAIQSDADGRLQQPAAQRSIPQTVAQAPAQSAADAQAAAHALTRDQLQPSDRDSYDQDSLDASGPLTDEEAAQQRANAAALSKAASMEAVRKAISASVAAASKGELPLESVDCAKVGSGFTGGTYITAVTAQRGHTPASSVQCISGLHVCVSPLRCRELSTCAAGLQVWRGSRLQGYWRVIPPDCQQWAPFSVHQSRDSFSQPPLFPWCRLASMARHPGTGGSSRPAAGSGRCTMTPASSPTCCRFLCRQCFYSRSCIGLLSSTYLSPPEDIDASTPAARKRYTRH